MMRPKTAKVSKVPEITLLFWIIKIAATRLGETGGDMLSMSMDLGYLLNTAVFGAIFVAAIIAQIRATRFLPFLYWATIIATTTFGAILADFTVRSFGYPGGTSLLLALIAVSLLSWQHSFGSISIDNLSSPKAELFYWMSIMFSQMLGTVLGDWTADSAGLGYGGSAVLFSALLLAVCVHYYWGSTSRALLFWLAFILSGPLGAFLGDFLDKPVTAGGLALSRYTASVVLAAFCVTCLLLSPHRAAKQAH